MEGRRHWFARVGSVHGIPVAWQGWVIAFTWLLIVFGGAGAIVVNRGSLGTIVAWVAACVLSFALIVMVFRDRFEGAVPAPAPGGNSLADSLEDPTLSDDAKRQLLEEFSRDEPFEPEAPI